MHCSVMLITKENPFDYCSDNKNCSLIEDIMFNNFLVDEDINYEDMSEDAKAEYDSKHIFDYFTIGGGWAGILVESEEIAERFKDNLKDSCIQVKKLTKERLQYILENHTAYIIDDVNNPDYIYEEFRYKYNWEEKKFEKEEIKDYKDIINKLLNEEEYQEYYITFLDTHE